MHAFTTRAYFDVTSGNNLDSEKIHEDEMFEQEERYITSFLRKTQRLRIRKIPKYAIGT